MMQELRNFSKAFLIFVVVAFVGSIIFAWGMDIGRGSGAKGYIAKINGEEIDPNVYDNMVNNYVSQVNQNGRIYLDWATNVEIRREAWDQMVQNIVMRQHIADLGLKVSQEELFQFLWNYPPRYLWNQEVFQTNGQFDMDKYHQFLGDPNYATQVASIEQEEEPQILNYQWNELLRSTIHITPEELMHEFRRSSEQIKVDYAFVNLRQVADPQPDPDSAQVREFYNEHKDKYERDAQANLEYMAFDVVPTAADSADVSDLKIWIQQAAESQEDIFPTMARIVSDDPRARQTGGNVGWVQKGGYSPEWDSAAFALDSGQITMEPVKTMVGWHILKSYGKRTNDEGVEEVNIYQIVKKIRPSAETFSQVNSQAGIVRDELKESTLEDVAAKYSMEVDTTGLFFEGNIVRGLGTSEETNKFAFESKVGAISDVILVGNLQDNKFKFIIAKVIEKLPKRTLPFDEAYNMALNDLKQKILLDRAQEIGQKIYDEASKTMDLKEAAINNNAEYITVDSFFTRTDTRATRLATDPQFMGAAFSLTGEEMLSKPVFTKNGVAVIMRTGRIFNPAEFDTKRDIIYKSLWAQKVREVSQLWSTKMMDNANIEDYRRLGYKWLF
jgi:peptidyl-prolyl cis-trans isomerase D